MPAPDAQITELDSGTRVVTEAVPSVRSVALGLWVRTGSRDKTPAQAGVSHFLEHLLFKGTKRYSAIEIAEIFDGLGAAVNAATGKESTNLHARFLDTHTDEAFDLLAEMLLGPTYPEIDSEREVVLEEIAMYEDEPQDKVHDVLDRAVFGGHPLGRRVLGKAEVISSIPVPDIDAYHRARYTGANIVVAAAGNVEHEKIVELARRHVEPPKAAGNGTALDAPQVDGAQIGFQQKDTEQFHICFGGPGIDRSDERRYALGILDAVFGGSTSSRLFREVREKKGLAYAVGSYTQQYVDSGMIGIYVGTRGDNVQEACEIIGRELGLDPYRGHHRRRAHPCEGARQGTDGPFLGVDRRPDGADRQVAPLRHPPSDARRAAREGRRGQLPGRRRARPRALRAGFALRGRHRAERGALPLGAGARQRGARRGVDRDLASFFGYAEGTPQ